MKFIQTDNQITIVQNTYLPYFLSALVIVVAVVLIIFSSNSNANAGTKHLFLAVSGLFILAGVMMSVWSEYKKQTTITLGGNTELVRMQLGRKSVQSFPTSSIHGIRLVTSLGDGQRISTILAVLNDTSSQTIVEGSGEANISIFGTPLNMLFSKPPLEDKAKQIAAFLHVPIDENNLASASGIIHTVQEVLDEAHNNMASDQLDGLVPPQAREAWEAKKAEKLKPPTA